MFSQTLLKSSQIWVCSVCSDPDQEQSDLGLAQTVRISPVMKKREKFLVCFIKDTMSISFFASCQLHNKTVEEILMLLVLNLITSNFACSVTQLFEPSGEKT